MPALVSLRLAFDAGADVADLDLLSHLGNTALHLGDDEAHHRCFTQMAAGARDAGAGMLVLYALPRLGFSQVVTGRWAALRASAEEALSLSASAGQRQLAAVPLGWLTLLAALQGRPGRRVRLAAGRPRHVVASSPSAYSPTRCTTSRAGRKEPEPPTTATPGPRCTTSAAFGSAPSAASRSSTASTPPSAPASASRPRRG